MTFQTRRASGLLALSLSNGLSSSRLRAGKAVIILLVLLALGGAALAFYLQRQDTPSVHPETLIPAETTAALVIDNPRAWEALRPIADDSSWLNNFREDIRKEWKLDLDKDIMSWAGRGVVSLDLSVNYLQPTLIGVVGIRDTRIAADTITRIRQGYENQGTRFSTIKYEGVDIYSAQIAGQPGAPQPVPGMLQPQLGIRAFANAGGCVIVSNAEAGVKSSIDLLNKKKDRKALADSDSWKRLIEYSGKDSSILLAVDLGSLMDRLTPALAMMGGAAGSPEQQQMQATIEAYQSLGWLGLSAALNPEDLRLTIPVTLRSGFIKDMISPYAELPAADQSSLKFIPKQSLGFIAQTSTPDFVRENWKRNQEWSKKLGAPMQESLKQYERLEKRTLVNLREDVFGAIQGEMALAALPAGQGAAVSYLAVIPGKDEATLRAKWSKVRAAAERSGIQFTQTEYKEVPILKVRVNGKAASNALTGISGGSLNPILSAVNLGDFELAIAQSGKHLLLATTEEALKASLDAARSGETFAENEGYQSMQSQIANGSIQIGYVDMVAIANRLLPTGQFGPWSFRELSEATKRVKGIVVMGRYQPEAVQIVLISGGNLQQVSDLYEKARGPLSLFFPQLGGLTGGSAIPPQPAPVPVPEPRGLGGGPTAQGAGASQTQRPGISPHMLPPGALPPGRMTAPPPATRPSTPPVSGSAR